MRLLLSSRWFHIQLIVLAVVLGVGIPCSRWSNVKRSLKFGSCVHEKYWVAGKRVESHLFGDNIVYTVHPWGRPYDLHEVEGPINPKRKPVTIDVAVADDGSVCTVESLDVINDWILLLVTPTLAYIVVQALIRRLRRLAGDTSATGLADIAIPAAPSHP